MVQILKILTLENTGDNNERMEGGESEYLPQHTHFSNKGKQNLFDEWMDSIERMDAFVTDKPTYMEIDKEAMDYMDEDPILLTLREEGMYQEPPAIVEAIIELKIWAWEGAAHPMEDSVKKIMTVKLVILTKKIKMVEPVTPAKNIVSVPIESSSANIFVPIKFVCDSFPVESVENSFPFNMISDSIYLLVLNVFIFEIGKENINNKE